MASVLDWSIARTAEAVKKGEASAVEITKTYLDRIRQVNEKIHAFLSVMEKEALEKAQDIEKRRSESKPLGRLAGVTVAVKDNMLWEGHPVTCASKILEGYQSVYTATALKRLESEDAILVGKTNLDEFAMGSSTEHSAFGVTKNPWDMERVPGGSSGGSAAAVAAGMSLAALGSDTGGSIRQPAALTGTVGFKPTYGTVSRWGLVAFASSLDQIGPMTRSVEDARVIFETISGHDPMDSTSLKENPPPAQNKNNLRIGLPKEYFEKAALDAEAGTALENAKKIFEKDGFEILPVSLPHTPYALPTYYILAPSEASANLARYDGIRYGARKNPGGLSELYHQSRAQGFGPEVQRRILIGTFALSHGYYEAYYGKAQQARRRIGLDFEEAFKKVDFILTPTTPTPAFKIGEKTQDPVSMYLADVFTIPANLAGIPAISIPCGFTRDGLPIGLQLMGPQNSDFSVLDTAARFEQATQSQFVRRASLN